MSNGRIRGKKKNSTEDAAPGRWTVNEAFNALKEELWPRRFYATGGEISTLNGYIYHAFPTSDTFTVGGASGQVDILVIAGGGGGGYGYAAGGGAGGLQFFQSETLPKGEYSVVIGAGGRGGGTSAYGRGLEGSNSSFGSLPASIGGGSGGAQPSRNGANGGSGGGSYSATAGLGTAGQGHNGSSARFGAGGGAGGPASGGLAGPGVDTFNEWSLATGYGKLVSGTYWFAAGGNGELDGTTSSGRTPGYGDADANTGCGGAGNAGNPLGAGSGIVIIRYPI